MKTFVRSLSRANDKTDKKLDAVKDFYTENEMSFKALQKQARKALVRPIISRSVIQKNKIVIPKSGLNKRKWSSLKSIANPIKDEDPFKYSSVPTYKNSALPKPSSFGPQRYYNSVNTQRFVAEQVVQFVEQVANPDPSLSPFYDPCIDPVLHVGEFNDIEINWKDRKPLQI